MNFENKNESAINVTTNITETESNVAKCSDTTPSILPIDNKITFLGKLCRNNHNYNLTGMSRRFVKGNKCTECRANTGKKWYREHSGYCNNLTNEWRENNRDRSNELARQWRSFNTQKCEQAKRAYRKRGLFENRFINKKSACKCSNIKFDLTIEFLKDIWNKQGGKCYWLNVPLKMELEKIHPLTATLERLDPNGGYTQDNVVWASYLANTGRRDCSAEEFKNVLSLVKDGLSP